MASVKSLIKLLIFFSILMLSVVWLARNEQLKNTASLTQTNSVFIPQLAAKLVEIDNIIIESAQQRFEFIKENDLWQLANKYPVNNFLVNNLLIEISSLKLLDKKTAKDERLAQLQLKGPHEPNSKAMRVVLRTKSQSEPVVDLIIGKSLSVVMGEENTSKIFVRNANDTQAFLVLGELSLSVDLQSWLEPPLNELPSVASVRKLSIINNDAKTVFMRSLPADEFKLVNKTHVFNKKKLHDFLNDLLAIECNDVIAKPSRLPAPKFLEDLIGKPKLFNNPQRYYLAHKPGITDLQVILETFDNMRYTFEVSAFGQQIVAQIEGKFLKQFPQDYPSVLKPVQQAVVTLPIKQNYLYKLSNNTFNLINLAQGDILNG